MEGDEATLWVTDDTGTTVLMANLTNLASWRRDGTITSEGELKREWLRIEGT